MPFVFWRDLLLCAKHLFVAAIYGSSLYCPQIAAKTTGSATFNVSRQWVVLRGSDRRGPIVSAAVVRRGAFFLGGGLLIFGA
jgi:hypothetical protein